MEAVLKALAQFDAAGAQGLAVVSAFEQIADRNAWDETDIVIAIAQFSGFPARVALAGGVYLRADRTGVVTHEVNAPHEKWPAERLTADDPPSLWLERIGPMTVLEAAVLHSGAELLRRLRGGPHGSGETELADPLAALVTSSDQKLIATLLDRLGLTADTQCVAVAQPGPTVSFQLVTAADAATYWSDPADRDRRFGTTRTGIGIPVTAADLNTSWKSALVALAFASESSDYDPGPTSVRFADLGLLAELPKIHDLGLANDVVAITRLCAETLWAARTLDAVARQSSLRLAASMLFTHHSTVQSRVGILERRLGWPLASVDGKVRLQLALAARRFLLHGLEQATPRSAFAGSRDETTATQRP